MVTRYAFKPDTMSDCWCELLVDPSGDMVSFESYRKLDSQLAEAHAALRRCTDALLMVHGDDARLDGAYEQGCRVLASR